MRAIAVVGASLAGVSAAGALRAQGYEGRLVVVGDEPVAPYDRPPLSKEFLAGTIGAEELALVAPEEDDLALEWRLGARARELDPSGRAVVLETGERIPADGVVVATGARARPWPDPVPAGVHTLRTLDDAVALRADLTPGARLVVIGGGFVGAEVASTARALGLDVTVVEAAARPLAAQLGSRMAEVCTALHGENGTRLRCAESVVEIVGGDRVRGVRLTGGDEIPADVVVVGIGSVPNVEWLGSCGLASTSGVPTDGTGATSNPAVVAAGDCASRYDAGAGRAVRHEHWSAAQQHPRTAAAALLGRSATVPTSARAPYFWSDQYGHRLQFAGHLDGGEEVEIVEGDPADRDFVAVYRRGTTPVAVVAMDRARAFGGWRRRIVTAGPGPTVARSA